MPSSDYLIKDDLTVQWRHFITPELYADRLLRIIARGPSPPDLVQHRDVRVGPCNIETLGPDHQVGFLFRCIPWLADVVVQVTALTDAGAPGGPRTVVSGPAVPLVLDRGFQDAVAARLATAGGVEVADMPLLTSVRLTVQNQAGGQHLHGTGLLATYLPLCQQLWIAADQIPYAKLATAPMLSLRVLYVMDAADDYLWARDGGAQSVVGAILANPQVQTLTMSRKVAIKLATMLMGRKVLVRGGLMGVGSEGSTSLVTLGDPSEPWEHHWVETELGSQEDLIEGLGVPHYQTLPLVAGQNPTPYWSRVLDPRASNLALPGPMTDLVCNELVASRCYDGLEGMVNLTVLLELLGQGSAEIHGQLLRWLVTLGPRGLGYRLT